MLCSRQPKTNEQASAASVAWISEAQSGNRIIRCEASQMFGFQLGASMPTENNTTTSFQRRFASKITIPGLRFAYPGYIAHNPKVEGSNPSPATNAQHKAPASPALCVCAVSAPFSGVSFTSSAFPHGQHRELHRQATTLGQRAPAPHSSWPGNSHQTSRPVP